MKEIWKKIKVELINPNWIIEDYYDVSNLGRIRNNKTGRILNNSSGKYTLHCKQCGRGVWSVCGDRATFNIKNIMKATFENEYTFGKHFK